MNHSKAIKSAAFLVLLAVSLPVVSDSNVFLVDMRVVENGVELTTPRMLVEEGAEASTSLTGDDAVAIGLIVNSAGNGEAHILAEVETADGQMSPELMMQKDQWGMVSTGGLEFHIRVQDHVANE